MQIRRFTLMLLLFILFHYFTGIAQPKQLCFEHLNVRTGLPDDYVAQIIQDEKGYIWLNTGSLLSRYDGYKFKTYKFGQELNERICDDGIFFDRNKRLWVCTRHGYLFRYDPVLDSLLPERSAPNRKKELDYFTFFTDKQNNIWDVGFDNKKNILFLEQYNFKNKRTKQFSNEQKENQFIDSGLTTGRPLVTKSGDIFLGTSNGLYEYDFKTGNFEHYLSSPDSVRTISIIDFAENKDDTSLLWLLARHFNEQQFTLYLFNSRDKTLKACASFKRTVEKYEGALYRRYLYENKQGKLWLLFKEGLYRYDRQTGDTTGYSFPQSDKYAKEWQAAEIKADDKEGNLWLKTNFGVLYLNTSNGKFQRYMANPSDPNALAHNHVLDIFEDQSGVVWVGMDEYGVDKVNSLRSSFGTLEYNSLQPGSYPENVTGIAQRPDGNYWVTTQRGLFEWNTGTNYFKKITVGNKDKNLYTGYPVCFEDGDLYYISANGAFNMYSSAGKHVSFMLPQNDYPAQLFRNSGHGIWVLSYKNRLYQFDAYSHLFNLYSFVDAAGKNLTPDTLNYAFRYALYDDRQGTLWLSTPEMGLCRVDRVKRTIITSSSFQGDIFKNINEMYEDAEGNFWLGTGDKGLWLFDRKSGKLLKQVIDKNGVLSRRIDGIAEDKTGNLWFCSEKGLLKFNYQHNSLSGYTVANNIPFEVPVGSTYALTKTGAGEFLLCMFNSIMRFDPDEIKPNSVPPVVQIESITYSNPRSKQPDERMINITGTTNFSLPYNHNRVTFNFVALHYVNSLQNQYAYKLDEFDKNWVQAGTERKVTYNNLDPGTYTFQVKAANSDGIWSTKDESITVIITPPWWETWWFRILSVISMIAVVYAIVQQHSRNLKKQNIILEEKVMQRTKELKHSLEELRQTQSQLIQSEKMASLGELTAGIAHEIQNPLNFVNNFSEVNKEMIDELQTELKSGNVDEAIAISNDIKENEEKINHHGKRADAIVKGMLQHSRKSEGVKEPTDINALCDEYLRLSYHGMRAKDKNFNAEIKTDFDDSIGKINVVPQDIGRVLLNLFNNAFYAVNEKKKSANEDHEPIVSVRTKRVDSKLEIHVKDNGNGIPENIIDKIFHPFFTTKPTGEGTGLGLSLAYDIIKAHGGEIKVESKEFEGTKFIIELAIK